MSVDTLSRLTETCARISGPDGTGTGYLVAPNRLATALHVVKSWRKDQQFPVVVGLDGPICQARLLKADPAHDAAILEIVEGKLAVDPLPLADRLQRKAEWEAFGYPATASGERSPTGLPLSGNVMAPNIRDDAGHDALLLFSEMIAAGNATPLHGFSGSPVLVEGAVVGHFTKHLGDPDDRRRAAYGMVYACPIAVVRGMLDVAPAAVTISPPKLPLLADAIPQIPETLYHVFVSYRSTDREWAMSLVARLEGAGLRAFIDQRELELGGYLANQIQSALERSRAAVVLVSRGWLDSPWCQQEANALINRAVADRSFKLIPLRLDASTMPPLLDSRIWLDFNGVLRAEGQNVQKLINTLIDRKQPSSESPVGRIEASDARIVEEFVAQIETAGRNNPMRVWKLVSEWLLVRSSDVTPLITAAEVLIGQNCPEMARDALNGAAETLRVRQVRALAYAKAGDNDRAIELLEQLQKQGELDSETGGLLAGRYKARWLQTGDRAFLQASNRLYRETYERTGDPFNGINAAAMALQCDERPDMHRYASQVRDSLSARPRGSLGHWDLATLGEAFLLLGRFDDARDWYGQAVGFAAGRSQDIAVMRRQARLNLEALNEPRNKFDAVFPVPRVLAYMGHMVDEEDRVKPRFPRAKVGSVREEIRKRLRNLGPLHGFGQAARGSDILFLETLVERGLGATVVLPFPEADFLATSGGGHWNRRFLKIKDDGRVEIREISSVRPAGTDLPKAFADANEEVQRRAIAYAKRLDEAPVVMAVWDRNSGDGPGGTADAVALWQDEGYEIDVIDITKL